MDEFVRDRMGSLASWQKIKKNNLSDTKRHSDASPAYLTAGQDNRKKKKRTPTLLSGAT